MSDKIEGRNPVAEALRSGRQIDKLYVKRGEKQGSILPIIRQAKKRGIIVSEVDAAKLNEMSETGSHQGVIALVPPIEYADIEDVFALAEERGEPPFIVILDRINDPHNLGSVIRTANCAGAHGVIISRHDSVSVTATVEKSSAGATAYTPIVRVNNLSKVIDLLKERGVWVTGADAAGDRDLYGADLKGAAAIVIGSEGEGISRLVAEKCDFLVKIPMKGQINSLNASVAAALMIYECARQRNSF